jgi:iron complex transport system ATP-binding protein
MPDPLLFVNNLAVGYKKGAHSTPLFDNVDLALNAGELVCFMGPNGIGKSTLIKTLAGLLPPLSHKKYTIDPKKVAVVLTDSVHALNMTARELISYGRYPHVHWTSLLSSADRAIVNNVIEKLHLEGLADRSIRELSDGQLQMVMIAKAMAQDTPIILLDEATAHLDLNNRVEIMNVLRNLAHGTGKAILMATHELDLALQTADVLWLADGKTIVSGVPEDLVLDGTLDRIFQLKGFDLKTGKMFHEVHRGIAIKLIGEGHYYWWTKNALERCGYMVANEGLEVTVTEAGSWNSEVGSFRSVKDLLAALLVKKP